jgi:hypothetical protein
MRDPSLSRFHARLDYKNGKFFIEGTYTGSATISQEVLPWTTKSNLSSRGSRMTWPSRS